MAVHRALHGLDGQQTPKAQATLSMQARRIVELEALLTAQLAIGVHRAHRLAQAGNAARTEIGAVFSGLGSSLVDNGLGGALVVRDAARVQNALDKVDHDTLQPALGRMQQAIAPVEQWIGGLRAELAAPLDAARATLEQSQSLHKSVLVVDDDRFVALALQKILALAEREVRCVFTAAEAMQALSQGTPDLILLDVDLPDSNGIEVLRQLKAHRRWSSIPVVMLTGRGEKEIIVACMAAGASDFIVKPFDRDSLLKKVQRSLAS